MEKFPFFSLTFFPFSSIPCLVLLSSVIAHRSWRLTGYRREGESEGFSGARSVKGSRGGGGAGREGRSVGGECDLSVRRDSWDSAPDLRKQQLLCNVLLSSFC